MSGGRAAPRSHRLAPADLHLWRQVTRDIVPLRPPVAEPEPPTRPPPSPPPVVTVQAPHMPVRPRAAAPARALEPGIVADLDRATAERLRRGDLAIDARLDLHGLTQDEAHAALDRFVAASQALGRRCVLVITGKGFRGGGPGVLKSALPRWLNEGGMRARTLAIMPAQPRHGGGGAYYLLLKRQRQPRS